MKLNVLTVFCASSFLLFPACAPARVWYVTAGASGNGASWNTPFGSISAAATAAIPGDEVWVTVGQYSAFTITKGIGVYGGFAGTETSRDARNLNKNVSIIDGGGSANSVSDVTIDAPVTDPPVVLDGFTIRNGGGTFQTLPICTRGCVYIAGFWGGGVYVARGGPMISHNLIVSNNIDHAPTDPFWAYVPGEGGGIYVRSGCPTIADNVIANNVVAPNSGGIGAAAGGGIAINAGSAIVVNNTVVHNSADVGGAVDGAGVLVNNIVVGNTSHSPNIAGTWTMISNDIQGNTEDGTPPYPIGTNGNISVDPAFVDPNSDFRLAGTSPLIDAGFDGVIPTGSTDRQGVPRLEGAHVDIGAYESAGATADVPPVTSVKVRPGGSDQADGLTWSTAKATVQAADDIAWASGADVWVAAGTYVGNVTLRPLTRLYGGFSGTESGLQERSIAANPTILEATPGATTPVVTAASGTPSCAVDGFTIRKGSGGIASTSSVITIANNHITGNWGSGIYITSDYLYDGACTITGNTVSGNSAPYVGGGMEVVSGGSVPCVVARNVISGNQATNGGGIYCYGANVLLDSNLIYGNYASDGSGIMTGTARVVNCTVVGNTGSGGSGADGIYVRSGTVANCIVAFNAAGIFLQREGTTVMASNDVFGNTLYAFADNSGQFTDPGVLAVDPLFIDAAHGDYHLLSTSPCIDAGTDNYVTTGAHDLDGNLRRQGAHVDIGCYEAQSPSTPTFPEVTRALRLAGGLDTASQDDITQLDVVESAFSKVNLLDAIRLVRRAVGLDI